MANGVRYGLAASIWTRPLESTQLSHLTGLSDLEALAMGV